MFVFIANFNQDFYYSINFIDISNKRNVSSIDLTPVWEIDTEYKNRHWI